MGKKISRIAAAKIFEDKYMVPIYQRNYAWREEQVQQLLDDINSNESDSYYLGVLVVKDEKGYYEVIDGQQRLTTLYLLATYLNKFKTSCKDFDFDYIKGKLSYQAREIYKEALDKLLIETLDKPRQPKRRQEDEIVATVVRERYGSIEKYFKGFTSDAKGEFLEKLKKSYLIRVQVPDKTDLNHYFEIMNTRGEQLEPHEIAKEKILQKLQEKDQTAAAIIWDCCADMGSYVQMNFKKDVRDKIFFSGDFNLFEKEEEKEDEWENIKARLLPAQKGSEKKAQEDSKKNLEMLLDEEKKDINKNGYKTSSESERGKSSEQGTEETQRFDSIISFPNFLLQVNAVGSSKKIEGDDDPSLDDKALIDNLKENWSSRGKAEEFLVKMLRCRVLFDKFIIKRDYAGEYRQKGHWSLQELQLQKENLHYVDTFGKNTTQLKRLQSALRITYTSPKSMRWITEVLTLLLENAEKGFTVEASVLIDKLEKYCIDKIKILENGNKEKYERGEGLERIVFSYLDYLLLYSDASKYRGIADQYMEKLSKEKKESKKWEFQYRTSVEHFFPQSGLHSETEKQKWEKHLNIFGNLALITESANSSLSDRDPREKVIRTEIMYQSPKLMVMANMVDPEHNGDWNTDKASKHGQEMIDILVKDAEQHLGTNKESSNVDTPAATE